MPISGECFTPASQYLMAGSLMSHVPDDAVVRRVEDIVQGHSKLHHTKSAGKMTRVVGHFANDFLPQLVADLRQCFEGQSPEVGRKMYLR